MEDKKNNKIKLNTKTKIFFCACLVVAVGSFDVFLGIVLAFFFVGTLRGFGCNFRNQGGTTGQSHARSKSYDGWGHSVWNYNSWAHRTMRSSNDNWRRNH